MKLPATGGRVSEPPEHRSSAAAHTLPVRAWPARVRRARPALPLNPRWLLALALLGLTGLALSGLPAVPPPGRALPAADEVLAYHIEADRDLVIKIPIEIDAVEVTTWASVKADACDAAKRYPYGFAATFTDERGKEIARHEYDLESRVSCDPDRPLGEGEYAARLDHGTDAVTDPRSTLLRTHDVLPQGGLLHLRAKPAATVDGEPVELTILSRIEGRYQRSEASRAIFEQSLDAEERQRIARRVSSLGFPDLPEPARAAVLTGWARRLEAAGREGTDYRISRLLLREFRAPYPRAEGRGAAEFIIGERHAAALNFRGPVSLDVQGPPGRTVRVADGESAPLSVSLGAAGTATVLLSRADIRTAVIDGVGPDFGVRFAVPEEQALLQIGEIVHPALPAPRGVDAASAIAATGLPVRLQTPPDVRVVRYLNLDPSAPVTTRVAPGQELLALLIRTEIEVSGGVDHGEASVVARWGAGPAERAELRVELPRSRFEWWNEGFDASDPYLAILHVPPNVEHLEITGDPKTRVRLRTIEPGVMESIYRLPYQVELKEDEVWRYAPLDVSTWADVRATNLDQLERDGRFSDLREQVRIERAGQGGHTAGELPERTLLPEDAPVRRRLLMPAYQTPGEPYPGDAWTPLIEPKDLRIDGEGARAGRVTVIYRAEPGQLGKDVSLRIDGAAAASQPIVALSGTLRANASAGVHHVAVEGIGEGGAAFADAPPAAGGGIVRRRDVFELTQAQPMTLRFAQQAGETLHLVLFVVTPGENAKYQLRYALAGAAPGSRKGAFFRRVTIPEGVLAGRGGDLGVGTLWEATTERRGTDGVSRAVIRVGDDLAPGERSVRLELLASPQEELAKRVWIGAVLVGQRATQQAPEPRVWIEDDE